MYRVSQTVLLADRLRRLYTVRTIVGRFATPDNLFAGPEQLICTPSPKIEEGMETEPRRRLREALHDGRLQRDDVAEARVGVCGGAAGGRRVPPYVE